MLGGGCATFKTMNLFHNGALYLPFFGGGHLKRSTSKNRVIFYGGPPKCTSWEVGFCCRLVTQNPPINFPSICFVIPPVKIKG